MRRWYRKRAEARRGRWAGHGARVREGEEAWERGYALKQRVSHASSPLRERVSLSSMAHECAGDIGSALKGAGGVGQVVGGIGAPAVGRWGGGALNPALYSDRVAEAGVRPTSRFAAQIASR